MFSWDRLLRGLVGRAGLALVILGPSACYRGQPLGVEHQHLVFVNSSRLLLIDERRQRVADGGVSPDPLVIAFELAGQRELWRTAVPSRFITPSSSSSFAAVLGPYAGSNLLRVGLLDLSSGKFQNMPFLAADTSGNDVYRVAAATSDDGVFFASVLDGQLRVWETATGQLATEQRFGNERAAMVSFINGGHDLSLVLAQNRDDRLVSLVVLARLASGWQQEQRFDGVYAFSWTTRGLLYASARGVSRYDRRADKLLIAGLKLTGGHFSSDGRYAAYRAAQGPLNVYDFDAGRIVLSAEWRPSVRFHGTFVTAMTDGKLWRGDLSTGASKVLRDFGAPAETVKIPLFGGTSSKVHYEYLLNSDGSLLYYREPGDNTARVYAVDQL